MKNSAKRVKDEREEKDSESNLLIFGSTNNKQKQKKSNGKTSVKLKKDQGVMLKSHSSDLDPQPVRHNVGQPVGKNKSEDAVFQSEHEALMEMENELEQIFEQKLSHLLELQARLKYYLDDLTTLIPSDIDDLDIDG